MALSVNSVQHTAVKLKRTGHWYSQAIFHSYESNRRSAENLSFGGAGAIAMGLLGTWDTLRSIANSNDKLSLWNTIIRPAIWAASTVFTYIFTKAPEKPFETDLINNSIQDVTDKVSNNLEENKSLLKLIKNSSRLQNTLGSAVDKITSQIKEMLDETQLQNWDNLTNLINEVKQDFNLFPSSENNPLTEDDLIYQYLKEVIKNKELNREEQHFLRQVFNSVLNHGDNCIRPQVDEIIEHINELLISGGLSIIPNQWRYDPTTNKIQFTLVTTKGYTTEDPQTANKVHLAGLHVSVPFGYLFEMGEAITENVHSISNTDIGRKLSALNDISRASKGDLEKLNKAVLPLFEKVLIQLISSGLAQAVHVNYNKNSGEYTKITPLGRLENYLNSTGRAALARLTNKYGDITDLNILITGGAAAASDSRRQKDLVPVGGEKEEPLVQKENYSEVSNNSVIRDPANDRLLKLLLKGNEKIKGLDFELYKKEDSSLTTLKLGLLTLKVTEQARKKPLSQGALKELNEYLDKITSAIKARLDRNRIYIPINKEDGKITNKDLVRLDYILAILLEPLLSSQKEIIKLNNEQNVEFLELKDSDVTTKVLNKDSLFEMLIRKVNGIEKAEEKVQRLIDLLEPSQAKKLKEELQAVIESYRKAKVITQTQSPAEIPANGKVPVSKS